LPADFDEAELVAISVNAITNKATSNFISHSLYASKFSFPSVDILYTLLGNGSWGIGDGEEKALTPKHLLPPKRG
jgi:hypothetical protein